MFGLLPDSSLLNWLDELSVIHKENFRGRCGRLSSGPRSGSQEVHLCFKPQRIEQGPDGTRIGNAMVRHVEHSGSCSSSTDCRSANTSTTGEHEQRNTQILFRNNSQRMVAVEDQQPNVIRCIDHSRCSLVRRDDLRNETNGADDERSRERQEASGRQVSTDSRLRGSEEGQRRSGRRGESVGPVPQGLRNKLHALRIDGSRFRLQFIGEWHRVPLHETKFVSGANGPVRIAKSIGTRKRLIVGPGIERFFSLSREAQKFLEIQVYL